MNKEVAFLLVTDSAIVTAFLIFLSNIFLEKKLYRKILDFILIFISVSLSSIIQGIFIDKNGEVGFSIVVKLLTFLIPIVVVNLVFSGSWYKRMLSVLIIQAAVLILESFMWSWQILMGSQSIFWIKSLCLFVALMVFWLIRRFDKTKTNHTSKNSTVYFFTFSMSIVASIAILNSTNLFLIISLYLFQICVLVSFKVSERIHSKNHGYELEEQKQKLLSDYYLILENHHSEIQQLKSDMKLYLYNIREKLVLENYPQTEYLINQFNDKVFTNMNREYTSNTGINALLCQKIFDAEKLGIDCSFDITLDPNIKIDEYDLITVIGNLLDNAIEACKFNLYSSSVNFTLLCERQCVIIKCQNSIDGNHVNLTTRKKNKISHGLGLKSVQQMIEKYNGDLSFVWKDTTFSIELTLLDS